MLGTISGALARSLIQSWQKKSKKSTKKSKKKKKIKNLRNNFWGPCQVLNTVLAKKIEKINKKIEKKKKN